MTFYDYAAKAIDENGYTKWNCFLNTSEEYKPGEIVVDTFGNRYKIDYLIRKF